MACLPGLMKNVTQKVIEGSHCSCNITTCVPGMFPFINNSIRILDKLGK